MIFNLILIAVRVGPHTIARFGSFAEVVNAPDRRLKEVF
jgi:hypothetical protein